MKKIAFIIVCAICVAIILSLSPAGSASDTYYFIVINDRPEPLQKDSIPIEYNGVMYAPLSVFGSTVLKTYPITDHKSRIATIYSTSHFLRFQIGGDTRDDENNAYSFKAIMINQSFYVPVKEVCNFFGFGYSVVKESVAPAFIRITNSGATLSDAAFAKAAAQKMQSLFSEFLNSFAPAPPPTPTPPPPTPTPSGTVQPEVSVYLSFFGAGEETLRALNLLSLYGDRACFFFTPDEIRENAGLVRRISALGHSIGLVCSENLLEDYETGSKLLFEAARIKSVLIALDCEYSWYLGELAREAGLIIWCDSGIRMYGRDSSLYLWQLTYPLSLEDERADLAIYCSESSLSVLSGFFAYMYRNNFSVKPINEIAETYLNSNGVY